VKLKPSPSCRPAARRRKGISLRHTQHINLAKAYRREITGTLQRRLLLVLSPGLPANMDFLPLPKLPQQGAVVSSVNPHSRKYRHSLSYRIRCLPDSSPYRILPLFQTSAIHPTSQPHHFHSFLTNTASQIRHHNIISAAGVRTENRQGGEDDHKIQR
jgi:hypothetical protein